MRSIISGREMSIKMANKLHGYLVEKYSHMGKAYTCARLREEALARGASLDIIGVCDMEISQKGCFHLGERLAPCDFILHRYKTGCIKEELNRLAAKSYNGQDALNVYINKYHQVRTLHSEAFLMPEYLLATLSAGYENIAAKLGSSFVAKGLESSQGREVFLIRSEADYAQLKNRYGEEKECLFEEYVASSYGRDIRFFSIRGKVAACMTREAKQGFRANVALGADVRPYEITENIRQIASDIYEQTRLDFLGIDLLFGEEKPYFCEINVTPGIEGMERATGVNVAGLIMDTVIGDCAIEQ